MYKKVWYKILITFICAGLFVGCGYLVVYFQFMYPTEEVVIYENTRLCALDNFKTKINSFSQDDIVRVLNENEGNELKISLIKQLASTFDYEVDEVEARNKYGGTFYNYDGSTKMVTPALQDGDVVRISVPDFDSLEFTKEYIDKIKVSKGCSSLDGDYGVLLVDVFLEYMENAEIPIKVIDYIPTYNSEGDGFKVSENMESDIINMIYYDESFSNMLDRFAEVSIYGDDNPDWVRWSTLGGDKKSEPTKKIGKDTVRFEWLQWNSDPAKLPNQEPPKNLTYFYMDHNFLMGEVVQGSVDDLMSVGVNVRTYEQGADVVCPIDLKITNILFDDDAISYLEEKDIRNKGLSSISKLRFMVVEYEITNASPTDDIIPYDGEEFALANIEGSISLRTGNMYGFPQLSDDNVIIKVGETKSFVWWTSSDSLDSKYLVWGCNFKDRSNMVWFNKGTSETSN